MARSSGVRKRVLILGGTSEARDIARRLKLKGYDVITSLAGATSAPLLPEGQVRSGGFGGRSGLEDFLRKEGVALVVDAAAREARRLGLHTEVLTR